MGTMYIERVPPPAIGLYIYTRRGVYEFTLWDLQLFWDKVTPPQDEDDHWLWHGAVNTSTQGFPYGHFTLSVNGGPVTVRAHRIAYVLEKGDIPGDQWIRHVCPQGANTLCVNPDHLALGNAKQNAEDRIREGTQYRKLTEAQVLEARTLWAKGGVTFNELSRRYGVTATTIRDVIIGKTWAHLPVIGRG